MSKQNSSPVPGSQPTLLKTLGVFDGVAILIGITIIVVIFVLINFIYHRTLGMEGMQASKVVASATAVKLIGSVGAAFVSLLVIISATGSINGTAMAASRVYYAMARDGLFFK